MSILSMLVTARAKGHKRQDCACSKSLGNFGDVSALGGTCTADSESVTGAHGV